MDEIQNASQSACYAMPVAVDAPRIPLQASDPLPHIVHIHICMTAHLAPQQVILLKEISLLSTTGAITHYPCASVRLHQHSRQFIAGPLRFTSPRRLVPPPWEGLASPWLGIPRPSPRLRQAHGSWALQCAQDPSGWAPISA